MVKCQVEYPEDHNAPTRVFKRTYVSLYRQKGIVQALAIVFLSVEHRYCLRHIHENTKKQCNGLAYKQMLWKCATTTTIQGFQAAMKKLKDTSIGAHACLLHIPHEHWARSHFLGRAYSDVLLNNLCEVFEGKNVQGRDKPIITTAGFIREYYIKRNVHVLKVTDKCLGPLTPTKSTIMAKLKQDASNSLFNGIEVISRPRKKRIRGAMEEPVVKNERLVRICKIVNVQMNDGDVSKQIEQMVRFIRQEADEKANEISVSAEEEFNIEKLQLLEVEKKKIRQRYDANRSKVEDSEENCNNPSLSFLLQFHMTCCEYSMQLNASRIKVLQAQDDLVGAMREAASKDLLTVSHHEFQHQHNYEALLKALIVQLISCVVTVEASEVCCRKKNKRYLYINGGIRVLRLSEERWSMSSWEPAIEGFGGGWGGGGGKENEILMDMNYVGVEGIDNSKGGFRD
ncbi:V-type proton ATPase subunit E-like protein [Tanacetum coccineum]